jgi:lipoprotein-anchoring transpeptidase ErfK/SrfK
MKKFFVMMAALVAMTGVAKAEDVIITVDISDQIMLVETPTDYYEWNVSTGRKGYNTPRGVFQPYHMAKMHYSRKYDNAPMPNSIFFLDGYAIHATDAINNLGRPASHGCIRLHPQNAKWLYRIVSEYGKENTTIIIQN